MNFVVDEVRASESSLVDRVWYCQSSSAPGSFISQAFTRWEMVVARHQGKTTLTVHGPETKATPVEIPPDTEWLGITFKLGVYMPHLPPGSIMNLQDAELPGASHNSFWLKGATWEIPGYENADTFVQRLERQELLWRDPVVDSVLQGQTPAFSPRALQYRFVRATGLPCKLIQQIDRARHALALLQQGMPVVDTAFEAGYFDQSHLTNALKRFLGQTPAQIARLSAPE